jgi:hypothetical protein
LGGTESRPTRSGIGMEGGSSAAADKAPAAQAHSKKNPLFA